MPTHSIAARRRAVKAAGARRSPTQATPECLALAGAIVMRSHSHGAARFALFVLALAADELLVEISYSDLAAVLGIGVASCRRPIRQLIELGELEIVRRASGRRPSVYRIVVK